MMTSPDDQLDPLLDAWAQQHRIDQADAEAIRRSILGEPRPTLGATWWDDLNDQVTAAVVLAASYSYTDVRAVTRDEGHLAAA